MVSCKIRQSLSTACSRPVSTVMGAPLTDMNRTEASMGFRDRCLAVFLLTACANAEIDAISFAQKRYCFVEGGKTGTGKVVVKWKNVEWMK